ncbi:hypothetical protein FB107DRAFT_268614 [Schizophyllum commune]
MTNYISEALLLKAWNRGKLSREIYAGVDPSATSASSQTSYKWSFASKGSRTDHEALRSVREEIAAATYAKHGSSSEPSTSTRGKQVGPTLPSSTDLQLARETEEDTRETERRYKRKRDKLEALDRIEDLVGPKEVGREGMLEKKRARREEDRAYRERGDEGLEADESTLMGGGDDFHSYLNCIYMDLTTRRRAPTRAYDLRASAAPHTYVPDAASSVGRLSRIIILSLLTGLLSPASPAGAARPFGRPFESFPPCLVPET